MGATRIMLTLAIWAALVSALALLLFVCAGVIDTAAQSPRAYACLRFGGLGDLTGDTIWPCTAWYIHGQAESFWYWIGMGSSGPAQGFVLSDELHNLAVIGVIIVLVYVVTVWLAYLFALARSVADAILDR